MAAERRARHVERTTRRTAATELDRPSRRSGDETWHELLRISAEIFAKHGYSGTSLQQIADAVGMLKGSLYYYIAGKEDLLYEVVRTVLQSAVANVQPSLEGSEPALDRLQRATEAHLRHLMTNFAETRVYLNDVDKLSPKRRAQLPARDYVHLFHVLIEQGQKDGSIRADVDQAITLRSYLGFINSICMWYSPGSDATPEDVVKNVTTILRSGLQAS
jgi:AcrR family transcriptional regulator